MVRHTWFCIERGWTMKKGFCPDGTRSRVVKMKMLSRYQSASIFQPGGAYIAKERWAHSGRLTGVAVPATSGSFLSSRYPTQLLPFSLPFPSIHGTTANANEFLTHISFFSFSPSLERGGQKKNAKLVTIANHGLDSNPCRLRMEGVLNGYKTTDVEFFASKSPLAVLAAASHSSSFPFSLSLPSPSSLERTASTKLDKLGWGKVSRGGTTRENFIPSGVTVGTRFRSKGMDFRISDPEWLSIFPWNRAQLSRPCAKEEREGKARGGIIKIFHRCSISLRPGGAASKNTESKYFEKIGSSEIRKSGPERNSCWGERIARKRQREGEGGRENSGENGAWRRVSAFIESRKKSLEIEPSHSAMSLCDGESSWSLSRRRRKLCE